MFSLDACLIAKVEISLTILLSSKDVACWETFYAAILASAKVPLPILLAANEGILSAPKEPVVILLASILGISAASKSIAAFLILIIARLFYYLAVHGMLLGPTNDWPNAM